MELRRSCLQVTPFTVTKVIQLYETKNSLHSSMLVGKTGSAKSVTWRTLQQALTALNQKGEPGFNQVQPDEKWIVFDGPVDALWIESMNSVMDDNKVLTLINGERISMPEEMTSNNIQAIIESRTEKRTKGVFFPAGGKQMLCFLDDLNMPAHDLFGSQPPLELMRFWIDYGFWYDRQKQTPKYVKESQIKSIFGTMINQKLLLFNEEVFQGLLRAHPDYQDTQNGITRLWIHECFSQLRGNMLLIGIGGSGRQSLSTMAAFICEYQVFQVEVTKQYRKQEFREDIKKLYRLAGVDNKPTMFLFNDTQIVDESFLEDINNILSSGEVPNLYKQDEFVEVCVVCNALSEFARKDKVAETPDSLFSYLIERVRNNLHIVFCMSPVGELFRKVASIFVTTHQSVAQVSQRMKVELKRNNYVTPTNYLELVSGYKKYAASHKLGEQVSKLRNGLFKISDTREKVEAMTLDLEEAKKQVVEFQKQCDQYLSSILKQKGEADEQQRVSRVGENSKKIRAEELQCKAMAENAQMELDKALPALEEALKVPSFLTALIHRAPITFVAKPLFIFTLPLIYFTPFYQALESLNKKDMTEIKSYGRPPALVETVMHAVMTLLGKEPTWAEAKRQLGERQQQGKI
ncbi:hypothetical protein GOODEAATRI_012705 [Goodea atripinnis]|uniref:Dynein heavy chain AAA module D4 domain-containing protein n=1 Tax=Goodea atripinnis TaxID=208336 RepID=A0ABV0NJQ9_9TELE